MADNEYLKKSHPPRRNPQHNRPPPGVQKAMQTFGVRDLREMLNKKRQDQGESQGDKRRDPKSVKPPPPDPSYNYLKDPIRDKPKQQRKSDHERPKDRELYSSQQRHKEGSYSTRGNVQNPKDTEQQLENKENTTNIQEKGAFKKNQNSPQSEGAPKKELRFSDTPDIVERKPHFTRGGRNSFKITNAKRGGGRESKEEKIENPVNIKIELSTETGLRNCTLDENTKIPDIKHVPDKVSYQKSPRGGFRGGRGNFRGRGRGRGTFRGRGGSSFRGKGAEPKVDAAHQDHNSLNMEELQKTLPDVIEKGSQQSVDNGNSQSANSSLEKNDNDIKNENEMTQEDCEKNLQQYDEYDQENEEYNDANENYDDEYYSEYQNDSTEDAQNLLSDQSYENSPESEQYDRQSVDLNDSNLQTITITSSKFQDGEVTRSVEVTPIVGKQDVGDTKEDKSTEE